MSDGLLLRGLIFAGVVYYALNGMPPSGPAPAPSAPYTGPMSALHSASREMPADERLALSYAFDTGADMLRADTIGLVKNTDVAQEYALAFLTFSYNGIGKPAEKYPDTADAIEAELAKVYGSDIVPVDAAKRSQIADAFDEIGKAVR